MHHILIPVDAGQAQRTTSAITQAARLHKTEPAMVHLLSVRPPVSGHVAMMFKPSELHELQLDWGQEELAGAKGLLEAIGVPYDCTVRVGRSAQTIAATAQELGCDHIIFGDEGPGIAVRLFGSLAAQVRHLLSAPGGPVVMGS
ncbi:MAG: universal stress protein [Rubrivivax sp.]|nr:universal stress protein [Rubrivivax sp.]